jgi:hypothetical protein
LTGFIVHWVTTTIALLIVVMLLSESEPHRDRAEAKEDAWLRSLVERARSTDGARRSASDRVSLEPHAAD